MKKALTVARWEFVTTVTRRSYIFTVLAMPALFLALGGFTSLSMPRLIGRSVNKPAALVDKAGIVDLEFATSQATQREAIRTTPTGPANIGPPPPLQPFTDTDAALAALKSEEVSAVFVRDPPISVRDRSAMPSARA
jgi:hypothetical protein